MTQNRTPQQIQVDVDLLKERINLFEMAMQLYSQIPITRRPEGLNYGYLKNRVTELKNIFEKLSKTLRLSQNKVAASPELQYRLTNQITERSEEQFLGFLEAVMQSDTRYLSSANDLPQPSIRMPRDPPVHSFYIAPFAEIVAANNRLYEKIFNLEARLEGDPDILHDPLERLAENLFIVIHHAYTHCEPSHKTALINKLYGDLQVITPSKEKLTPLPLSTYDNFKDAFQKKFGNKALLGYDPKIILIINHWLHLTDPDYTSAQSQLIKLQQNQPLHMDIRRHEMHFDPEVEKELDDKKRKLQSNLADWMQHTSEHLMRASEKIRREAESFNDLVQRELDSLRKIEKWKPMLAKWIDGNKQFLPEKWNNQSKTFAFNLFKGKAHPTEIKMTIENDLTEAKKLQQLAKKHKKSAAAAELSPTFFDEKIEELKTQHAIATKAVEQLGLASKYLHECPHPCLNGMVEDFVRKAQANLVEAKEQITKIKNAMQEAVNPSEPAPTKRIPHPKASHTAKPNHTKANRRISRT